MIRMFGAVVLCTLILAAGVSCNSQTAKGGSPAQPTVVVKIDSSKITVATTTPQPRPAAPPRFHPEDNPFTRPDISITQDFSFDGSVGRIDGKDSQGRSFWYNYEKSPNGAMRGNGQDLDAQVFFFDIDVNGQISITDWQGEHFGGSLR